MRTRKRTPLRPKKATTSGEDPHAVQPTKAQARAIRARTRGTKGVAKADTMLEAFIAVVNGRFPDMLDGAVERTMTQRQQLYDARLAKLENIFVDHRVLNDGEVRSGYSDAKPFVTGSERAHQDDYEIVDRPPPNPDQGRIDELPKLLHLVHDLRRSADSNDSIANAIACAMLGPPNSPPKVVAVERDPIGVVDEIAHAVQVALNLMAREREYLDVIYRTVMVPAVIAPSPVAGTKNR